MGSPRINPLFWPDQAYVVVEVEDQRFKLLKDDLTSKSRVFSRALRGENPVLGDNVVKAPGMRVGEDTRWVDGCALYRVGGTTASDFAKLMLVCGRGATPWVQRTTPDHLDHAVFRAAWALGFEDTRRDTQKYLERRWSSDLDDMCGGVPGAYAGEAVVLARQYNLPQLLKHALYDLLAEPGFANRSGGRELSWDLQAKKDDISAVLYAYDKPQSSDTVLSIEDYRNFTKAREFLQAAWFTICTTYPEIDCPLLEDEPYKKPSDGVHGHCSPLKNKKARKFVYDPIRGLGTLTGETEWNAIEGWLICPGCTEAVRLWQELDALLGLERDDASAAR
ncbi:hypothetical protein PLICRDRAFT_28412 [Plicaturopsis crispa FD-325 SS-3]|nr:hypothetical protein PLICRDRAFT_28412 [Plicaturopsis crispa FD-325 SS-3]